MPRRKTIPKSLPSSLTARNKPASLPDFSAEPELFSESDALKPLAERMRPRTLDEIVGQSRLLGPGTALRRALEAHRGHWLRGGGPPGAGKPPRARRVPKYADALSGAFPGVLPGRADVGA